MYVLWCCMLFWGLSSLKPAPFKMKLPSGTKKKETDKCDLLEEDITSLNETLTATILKVDALAADMSGSSNTLSDRQYGEISTLEQKQTDLASQLTSISTSVSQQSDDIGKVSQLENDVTTIKSTMENMKSSIDSINANLELETADEGQTSVDNLQEEQKKLENQLQEVMGRMQGMNVNRCPSKRHHLTQEKLEADSKDLTSSVNNIKVLNVGKLQKDVQQVMGRQQTSQDDITILKKIVESLQKSFNELAGTLAAINVEDVENRLTNKIDALSVEIKAFKGKVEKERTDDKEHVNDIAAVNGDLKDFAERIMDIEVSIEEEKKGSNSGQTNDRQGDTPTKSMEKIVFHSTKLTFEDAKTRCHQMGGSLAILNTSDKRSEAYKTAKGYYTWAGFRRNTSNGDFYWLDTNERVTWKSGHPRNGEHCGYCGLHGNRLF